MTPVQSTCLYLETNRQLTQVNHPHGENLKGGMSTHGDSTRLSLTLGPLDGSSGAHVL